jgi:hypothetical protein
MSRHLHLTALAVIVLVELAPFFPVLIAGFIARANGCELNESSASACYIFGHDFGSIFYFMSMLGWFGLASLPIAVVLLIF